jgi:hypothetical protein
LPETVCGAPARLAKRFAYALAIVAVFLLGALALYGTGPAALAEEQETPDYEVLQVSDAPGVSEALVATGETREGGLRLIAEELREEDTPEDGTLLVEYYAAPDRAVNTGFALIFDSEQAVLDIGESERFGQVYDEEDAERIMREEDGMRVVSFEDFAEQNPSLWERAKQFLTR